MKEPIIISQSFIKAMSEEKGRCPSKAKAIYLEGMESKPSAAMIKGNFFETVAFGSTDSGEVVQMERTKAGAKSADQIRLEKQAYYLNTRHREHFKMDWASPREHITVPISIKGSKYKYVVRARTDMITSFMDMTGENLEEYPNGFVPRAIVDFKITDSILSTYGDFAWGLPHTMDHTQAHLYVWAYYKKYGKIVPFYYFVMDLSTRMDYKVVRKMVNATNFAELKQQFRALIAAIEQYEEHGWPIMPGHDNCTRCPLADTCPGYKQGKDIQVIW